MIRIVSAAPCSCGERDWALIDKSIVCIECQSIWGRINGRSEHDCAAMEEELANVRAELRAILSDGEKQRASGAEAKAEELLKAECHRLDRALAESRGEARELARSIFPQSVTGFGSHDLARRILAREAKPATKHDPEGIHEHGCECTECRPDLWKPLDNSPDFCGVDSCAPETIKQCGDCGHWQANRDRVGGHCEKDLPWWVLNHLDNPPASRFCFSDNIQANDCDCFSRRAKSPTDGGTK